MQKVGDLVTKYKLEDKDKYVSQEFQKYGYDLAQELGEPARVSFFIKLSKENPRGLLETARSFVADAQNVRSKGKLFVWKLAQLKKEKKDKENLKKLSDKGDLNAEKYLHVKRELH